MMKFRLAKKHDIDVVMQIMEEARASIGRLGIDQWQYGYPSREDAKMDIAQGLSYVGEDEQGEIGAIFAFLLEGDPNYEKITEGAWLTPSNTRYLSLHRVAVAMAKRGSGVSDEMMAFVEDYARNHGYDSIRVDTHKGNIPMRKMLGKNGFLATGTVFLATGEPRIAYEKMLGKL